MTWWRFDSVAAFSTWHHDACDAAGIPRPGVNQATGEVEGDHQWTTGIAEALLQHDGSVLAWIPSPWATPAGAVPADEPGAS